MEKVKRGWGGKGLGLPTTVEIVFGSQATSVAGQVKCVDNRYIVTLYL